MSELEDLRKLSRKECLEFYEDLLNSGNVDAIRWLARNDRFFLLGCLMCRSDVLERDWCFDRCREVESDPNGWLDLWSRFHYKSTIITLAGSIQEILRNPDITIGILSYNKATAKKFVDQVRRELEGETLYRIFPDILWEKPPRKNWSTQEGLVVKRQSNPKEPTIQGSGLVDGQPVGSHYSLMIYDDVVVPESVGTPEQIQKTTEAWELSLALGVPEGGRSWYAGTRYHPADTYSEILSRGALKERRRLCVDEEGNPTLMSKEALEKLQREMGPNTWAAQMLQNPIGSSVRVFRDEWLEYYDRAPDPHTMNIIILVDPAGDSKRKSNDYTVMWVVGLGADKNYYLLDGVCDKIDLHEREEAVFFLVQLWRCSRVFYEKVALCSDIMYLKDKMEDRNYRYNVTPLHQSIPKGERIRWLVPVFAEHRMYFPRHLIKTLADGTTVDLVQKFVNEEYTNFPICNHDDRLDALSMSRHPEMDVNFPHPKNAHRVTNWVRR